MTSDNGLIIDNAEASRLLVEGERNTLEELRAQMYGVSRDVISSYKRYSRSRSKVGAKESARALARLSKAEDELGRAISEYDVAKKRVHTSLSALMAVHGDYTGELYLSGDTTTAKRASRAMDSYTKRIERFIDKVDDSVACIVSLYTLRISVGDNKKEAYVSKDQTYGMQNTVQSSVVHTSEVEVSPVSIDIGPTVERAVECAISELSGALEKRIVETLEATRLPVADSPDAALITDAAERIGNAAAALSTVLSDLDKVVADVGALADRCRAIVEMQRTTSREMQGIEVKQRLVNQEQTALIEAQEVVLQHQRLIAEKHTEISGAQTAMADAVNSIIESQRSIDASLKESIKAQKSLLGSNAKYIERLNKRIEMAEAVSKEDNNE